MDTLQSSSSSALDRLDERAFDLSTRLLAARGDGSQLLVPQTPRIMSVEDVGASASQAYSGTAANSASSNGEKQNRTSIVKSRVNRPSLASVISDLQLVRESLGSNAGALSSSSGPPRVSFAAELVICNAVAAIHAHTIEQLLDAVLPLSIDIDYWNSQGGNSASLLLYFFETLPWRLYSWGAQVASSVSSCTRVQSLEPSKLLDALREALSIKLLFHDTDAMCTLLTEDSDARANTWRSKRFLNVPRSVNVLGLTRHEIHQKQRCLADAQENLATKIGELSLAASANTDCSSENMAILPASMLGQVAQVLESINQQETGCSSDVDAENNTQQPAEYSEILLLAEKLVSQIGAMSSQIAKQVKTHRRPSLLVRCWIPALAVIFATRYLSSYIAGRRDDFKEWLADSAVTMRNYVSQYILAPLHSAYETIRYGKHTYSVVTEESLASDFKALEDMVVGFAKRFGIDDANSVRLRVESGDLSDVMAVYAREMQQPFRNAVFGDLVEAMLIQVQKVKVDVGQTMAALDKLLKSNELNFLLLSTVPATLSIYAATSWVSTKLSWWINGSNRYTISSIQVIMRNIDRLLNTSTKDKTLPSESSRASAATLGRLICQSHYLRHHAAMLPNSASPGGLRTGSGWFSTLPHTRKMFLQDISDIESASLTNLQKRHVVDRMYRTFRFL
ncbi:Nuclear control of ATPase protein 2 [Coemansia sp. Benny D115]|nr:Nuclear control of ATPase protein 2 [Coemansia sp. Benny D115]